MATENKIACKSCDVPHDPNELTCGDCVGCVRHWTSYQWAYHYGRELFAYAPRTLWDRAKKEEWEMGYADGMGDRDV